jgi:hypothetical protein
MNKAAFVKSELFESDVCPGLGPNQCRVDFCLFSFFSTKPKQLRRPEYNALTLLLYEVS